MCGAWRDGAAAHGVVFDDEPSGSRGAFGAVGRGAFGSGAWGVRSRGAPGVRRASGRGKISPRCVPGRSPVAKCSRNAFPGVRQRQDFAPMRSRAAGPGKMSPWCVPGRRSVARFRRGVFPGSQPWQFFRLMRSRRGLGREKRRFVATFRRHVSEMSWFWQDSRAMRPKSPANSRLRIHCAKILPRRGPFRCTGPSNHARRADLAMPRRRHTRPAQKRSSEAVSASTPSRLPCL